MERWIVIYLIVNNKKIEMNYQYQSKDKNNQETK
jgi:hypothetical protein